jgi:hypothetical protein
LRARGTGKFIPLPVATQEYCRLFFSILLIEAPNTKDKIGYG